VISSTTAPKPTISSVPSRTGYQLSFQYRVTPGDDDSSPLNSCSVTGWPVARISLVTSRI